MRRENRKEAVAALHRERIMNAAERLFAEKGFEQTTIEDISAASAYSRRTIYAYFESKENILHYIVEQGLIALKEGVESAIGGSGDFIAAYRAVCAAMGDYQRRYRSSADHVAQASAAALAREDSSDTLRRILLLGTEINDMLAALIESGKEQGLVRRDVIPTLSVYVLWSGITSFLTLVQTKGQFLTKQLSLSEHELLDYGFRQLINAILEVRI